MLNKSYLELKSHFTYKLSGIEHKEERTLDNFNAIKSALLVNKKLGVWKDDVCLGFPIHDVEYVPNGSGGSICVYISNKRIPLPAGVSIWMFESFRVKVRSFYKTVKCLTHVCTIS
ncbi:MAG: hypothetical protein LBB34_00570 [Holosporales bacterium]|jgi:hypothetical protein|nr:hypothetical protein [Holosporales bacterium]